MRAGASAEWITVRFTPDLETNWSFFNRRCKLARTSKEADAEATPGQLVTLFGELATG